jgi:hypothetical protein
VVTCHFTAPSLDSTSEATVYKYEGININHITVQIVVVLEYVRVYLVGGLNYTCNADFVVVVTFHDVMASRLLASGVNYIENKH